MADSIPTGATGSKSTPTHHAFIRALLLSQTSQGYIGLCRAIATAQPLEYGKARCPALLIAGAEDKVVPVAGLEKIKDRYSVSKKKIILIGGIQTKSNSST